MYKTKWKFFQNLQYFTLEINPFSHFAMVPFTLEMAFFKAKNGVDNSSLNVKYNIVWQ